MSLLSFLVSILPVILIGIYIYSRDKEKESSRLLLKLFVFGILSCFPAVVLGSFIGDFFPSVNNMSFIQLFLYIFIAVALIEELCKWFFVYRISYNHSEFDTIYDMIVYSSFVALGFACFENILYVQSLGIVAGLVRAVSAVPGHVCDGILMGFYLGLSNMSRVQGDISQSKKYMLLSIFIPMITHGIYDFCLFWGSDLFVIIFVIFLINLFNICLKKVRQVSQNDIRFKYDTNYCANCGTRVDSNFCPICGKKND